MAFLKTMKGKIIVASSTGVILLGILVLMLTGQISGFNLMGNSVSKRNIAASTVIGATTQYYKGKTISPQIVVKYGNTPLRNGTDYTLTYSNNDGPGTAIISIVGKGMYTGTKTVRFQIVKLELAYETVQSQYYTGKPVTPNPKIINSKTNYVLKNGIDYTVSYKNNINIGEATYTVKFIGKYQGYSNHSDKFGICENINNMSVSNIPNQVYTGKEIKPNVVVKDPKTGYTLTKSSTGYHYDVVYSNNINVGSAKAEIIGNIFLYDNHAYKGTKTVNFNIVPANISKVTVAKIPNQAYTGKAIIPSNLNITFNGKVLQKGSEYVISKIEKNIELGRAEMTITGKGNFTGTKTVYFNIVNPNLANATILPIANQPYKNQAVTPSITVKFGNTVLRNNIDYTVRYTNNIKVGKATVTVTGKGKYVGTKTATFIIEKIQSIKLDKETRLTSGTCDKKSLTFEIYDTLNFKITKVEYSVNNGSTWITLGNTNITNISNNRVRVTIRKNYNQIKFRATNAAGVQKVTGNYKTCIK